MNRRGLFKGLFAAATMPAVASALKPEYLPLGFCGYARGSNTSVPTGGTAVISASPDADEYEVFDYMIGAWL